MQNNPSGGLFRRPWAFKNERTRFYKAEGMIKGHTVWHNSDHNGPLPFRGTYVVNGRITNYLDDPEGRYKPPYSRWRGYLYQITAPKEDQVSIMASASETAPEPEESPQSSPTDQ